jgi:hypothetical protein
MKKLRKFITVSVAMMTILSMSAVVVPNAGAAAVAGDLIKRDGLSAVYYLASDGQRYVFSDSTTYFSWYNDFSGVKTISQTELEGYTLGKNVTMRPGTKLIKVTTDPKVYAVEPGGKLSWVKTEAAALALYGTNWAKRIVDVNDSFFVNSYDRSNIKELDGTAYPLGSLIKTATGADVYYIGTDGKAQKITSESAFNANRFKMSDIITTTLAIPAAGTDITAAVSALTDTSSGAGGAAGAGTGLTVSLSSATSPSSTLVDNQALANLATFNLTASNDGAVKLTSFKVKRIGIGQDTTLPAVYLYEGTTRLTDDASVSSTFITWNNSAGIITVPAGGSKSITVKSNIANNTAGQTVGVQIAAAADVVTDGAAVSGSFPVSGNMHSIADGSLATVSFNTTTNPATAADVDPQDEFTIWDNTVTVGTRAVSLSSITFRQIGSIESKDLKNFKLYVKGVQVGTTIESLDASGNVIFDLSAAPLSLESGSPQFKVLANIVGGSSRTTSLSLRKAADVTVIDSEYNVPILVQANSTTFSARTSATQTITSGTLTITKKTNSASGNIVKGATNATLASYEFKAAGEAVKVETLRANVVVSDASTNELRNGKIYANGVQVGSTADLAASDVAGTYYTEYSLGSSLIVNPGSPVTVDIKADIYDSDGTDDVSSGDTLQAQIASSTSNAQRQVSLTFLSTPGSDTVGNTLTVKTGSLTCAKYTGYASQTVVIPQTSAYKLAEFRCTVGTTEALNITSFNIDFDASSGPTVATDLSDVYLVYGATTGTTKSAVASTTNAWNVNTTLASGASLAVSVYGKINSTMAANETLEADLTVSATSAGSAASANSTETTGQTITGTGSGTLTTAATEEQMDQIVLGGTTVTAATYKITATNDTFTVTEASIFVPSGAQNAVNKVYFYAEDGTTLLNPGGADMDGVNASSTGMNYVISANTTRKLIVKLGLNSIATGSSAPGYNASTTLNAVKVKNGSGTESTTGDDRQGNAVYVYKAYPVVSAVALTTAEREITNNTSQAIYKFKIAPASGTISVKQMSFTLAWTDTTIPAALELGTLKFFRGTTDITSLVSITNASGVSAKSGGTALAEADTTAGLVISWLTTTEEEISADTTYSIKATPANFDNGTTSSDKVSITMIGDASHIDGQYIGDNNGDGVFKLLATATTPTGGAGNFIWSDISLNGHSATSGSSTADWASGFLVKNLDLDATVMDVNP